MNVYFNFNLQFINVFVVSLFCMISSVRVSIFMFHLAVNKLFRRPVTACCLTLL